MIFVFVRLTSLSMIMSRSIHVVANSIISFFFKVVYRESLGVGSLSLPQVFFLIIKKNVFIFGCARPLLLCGRFSL